MPFWLKPFLVQNTSCCCRECQVQFGLFVSSTRLFMGRNRKFVLEDELQQAVWRTILRGPLAPSVKWDKPTPATNSGVSKQAQPGSGKNRGEDEATRSDFDTAPSFPLSRGGDGCCASSLSLHICSGCCSWRGCASACRSRRPRAVGAARHLTLAVSTEPLAPGLGG